MNYLVNTGEKPVSYTYEPPAGVPARSGKIEKQTVSIINGRPVADQITLDKQGFMRSGLAILNSAISGNSGQQGWPRKAGQQGVFDGQEIRAADAPHAHF